jgi:hypothetical protein
MTERFCQWVSRCPFPQKQLVKSCTKRFRGNAADAGVRALSADEDVRPRYGVADSVHDVFMETSAYFLAVRTVVNREDPVGLMRLGAPEDEYDPEVADLIKWRKAVTAEQVSAVFLRWFGEPGAMPSDVAARIADDINQARARHAPI